MKTWRIAAHGMFEGIAGEQPDDLLAPLRELLPSPPRRINRYARMTLIGAYRCLAQYPGALAPSTPLYLASEHGNIGETVALMEGILFRGQPPKPMSFVNVSSNMAGFYLAATLGLTGRNMTVSRLNSGFGAMLEMASLDPASDGPMLLGTVVESVWPLSDHRLRRELPADTPLVEASYWLVVDAGAAQSRATLGYATTQDIAQARAWLATGEQWFIDPHFAHAQCQQLAADLDLGKRAAAPLSHCGHAEAVAHALFTALQASSCTRLHAVAFDPSRGYQLLGVWRD